jgi:hypothetical protein
MVRGCNDSDAKRSGNRETKGIEGPQRQVAELFQQVTRRYSVCIGERPDMKMACPDIIFERRPRIALVVGGDITCASAVGQQTTQLDRGQPADYSAVCRR